jgi:hypothetical protein
MQSPMHTSLSKCACPRDPLPRIEIVLSLPRIESVLSLPRDLEENWFIQLNTQHTPSARLPRPQLPGCK